MWFLSHKFNSSSFSSLKNGVVQYLVQDCLQCLQGTHEHDKWLQCWESEWCVGWWSGHGAGSAVDENTSPGLYIFYLSAYKTAPISAQKMAQQLKMYTVLTEDLSSVPSTHIRWLITTCNSSTRTDTFFQPPWATVFKLIDTPTYTHNDR